MGFFDDTFSSIGDIGKNLSSSLADVGKNTASSLSDIGKNTISSAQDIARNPVQAIKGALDNPILNPIGALTSAPFGITPTQSYEVGALGGLAGTALGIGAGTGAAADAGAGLTAAGADAYAVPGSQEAMLAEQTAGMGGESFGAAGGAGTGAAGTAGGAATGGMTTGQMIALGLGGANLLGSMGKKPAEADPRLMGPASTLQAQSQQLIDQAMKGQLNPGDQARLAQSRQADIARTQDYYAKAGLSDSSMAQQAITDINARYDAAAYQITQGYYQQGIQAAGIADQGVARAVQMQMQQDAQAQQAQSQFFGMLMQYGMSH